MSPSLNALCLSAATILFAAFGAGPADVHPFPQGNLVSAGASGSAANDSNAKAWADAQRWFSKNDFAQAQSAANHVTSGPFSADAQAMLDHIRTYVSALQDGTNAEGRHDPVAAIQAYAIAARIKSDGPGNPAARILRVQQEAATQAPSTDPAALRAKLQAQHRAQAARLVEKGKVQEAAGDAAAALASYATALAEDPGNAAARDGASRLREQSQGVPPEEQRVAEAVRTFYRGNFAAAEQQLSALPTTDSGTKWRGAAFFYLGAARWYQSLADTNTTAESAFNVAETHAAFTQSKALGYAPVSSFVSPTLLKFWKTLP